MVTYVTQCRVEALPDFMSQPMKPSSNAKKPHNLDPLCTMSQKKNKMLLAKTLQLS